MTTTESPPVIFPSVRRILLTALLLPVLLTGRHLLPAFAQYTGSPSSKTPPARNAKPPPATKGKTQTLPSTTTGTTLPALTARPLAPALPKPALRSLLYGINVVLEANSKGTWDAKKAAQILARMQAAGATNTRLVLRWDALEKTRGKYDWHSADLMLRFWKASGLTLTCQVVGTPEWARDSDPAVSKLFADRNLADLQAFLPPEPAFAADLGRFALAVGKRYGSFVHRWEFWNEPDTLGMPTMARDEGGHPTGIRSSGDPTIYTRLLKIFSQNIKRAQPNSLVAVGGLATPRTEFLQALYVNGAQKAFDAVALHPAVGGGLLAFDWIDACRQVLNARHDGGKKIWLTEWGWATAPGDPGGIVEGEQARRIRQSLDGMRQRPFIEQADLTALADWRAEPADPLSLHSVGLFTRDLDVKPAFAAFREAAAGVPTSDPAKTHLVPLLAGENTVPDSAPRLDVFAGRFVAPLPRLWRGVAIRFEDTTTEQLAALGARGISAQATLLRMKPLDAPGTVTVAADGATPVVRWDEADSRLTALAQAGIGTVLDLTPPTGLPPAAWSAFVTLAAQRYGGAKYGVERWELTASSEQAAVWYEPFARAVRAVLPTTPISLLLTDSDPVNGTTTLAEMCATRSIPLDSLGWRITGDAAETARTVRRLRAVLAGFPTLKKTDLWPQLTGTETASPEAVASRLAAVASRLVEYAPTDQANPTGGALADLPEASSDSARARAVWDVLALLNRVAGIGLQTQTEASGLRCLATRSPQSGLSILVWREDDAPGETLARLRLHDVARSPQGGLRMEQYLLPSPMSVAPASPRLAGKAASPASNLEPFAVTDLPGSGGDLEIPLALPSHAVLLLTLKPHRAPLVQLSLTSPKYAYHSGDEMELIATVRNVAPTPQRADLLLTSSQPNMTPPALARMPIGVLAVGQSRAVRFRLPLPPVGQDMPVVLNLRAGQDNRASLTVHVASALTATLDTPRLDLADGSAKATARVRLVNLGNIPLPVFVRARRLDTETIADALKADLFTLPVGAKPVVHTVEIAAPSTDPGIYPADILVRSRGQILTFLRAYIGVPALCQYAQKMPVIDGDLSDWADAVPIGMGQREQVHDKAWRGPGDLSAYAYTRWDERFFYFACAVTDDVFFQPYSASDMGHGDSVFFALSTDRTTPPERAGYGPGDHEFGLALLNGTQPTLYRFAGPPGTAMGAVPRAVVAVRREGTRVFYEAAIPWAELTPAQPVSGEVFGLSLLVSDNDGQGRGYIAWGDGLTEPKHPGLFPPLRLTK